MGRLPGLPAAGARASIPSPLLSRPPRIRTDDNEFARHTMAVRVPAILETVLAQNPDYSASIATSVRELADDLRAGAPFPSLVRSQPDSGFSRALEARQGEGWLSSDWFFAETYAYRQLAERVGYFETGRDPFLSTKEEEYASPAHARAFESGLALAEARGADLGALFFAALFGNRMDLSFAASREHGLEASSDDLLLDDRERAAELARARPGPVHVVVDNAGTELTLDLVLVDFVLRHLAANVVLHLKIHPTFVSDATKADVLGFLRPPAEREPRFVAGRTFLERLRAALADGRIELRSHPFWNGPDSLWQAPAELVAELAGARLVILKGDANYRRALGDASYPPGVSFAEATDYFPAPLLALRTNKSDPLVGLDAERQRELEARDPSFRVNGRRGVASLGGTL